MPISREEFEGRGVDWRQRILYVLNADRNLAYTEEELRQRLNPTPSLDQMKEIMNTLIEDGLVRSTNLRGTIYYIHALPERM